MKARRIALPILCLAAVAIFAAGEARAAAEAPKKARSCIVERALSYKGAPYRYGGIDEKGFDCSGLVYRVFLQSLGASLPRTAREQRSSVEPIDASKMQPGDLLFFAKAGSVSHVGIYEGGGRFIHSASEGPAKGVIESSLEEGGWARSFVAAGRVVPPARFLGLTLGVLLPGKPGI
jgi:probable lipoprotein NlpC